MLYHIKTGFPFAMNLPPVLRLIYSKHAKGAALSDRYGYIELETEFSTEGAVIIELETDLQDKNPVKVVIRKPYNAKADLCIVVALDARQDDCFIVKTVWLNLKSDVHKTLDKNKYRVLNKAV